MRDIRSDLSERLKQIEAEREQIQLKLRQLASLENSIRNLIQEEHARWGTQSLFGEETPDQGHRTELGKFLMTILADGQPHRLGELKEAALSRGIDFEKKNPGRVLHFALLGMAQNSIVEMLSKGVWKLQTANNDNG